MSCRQKLFVLLIALLCKGVSGRAQSRPVPSAPPDSTQQQVVVPVPRAVSLLIDVATVLFTRDTDKNKLQTLIDRRRARAEKGDQNLRITVPKNQLTRTLGLVE